MMKRARRQYRMDVAAPGDGDGLDGFVGALSAHGYRGLLAIEDEGNGGDGRMLASWCARARALQASGNGAAPEVAHA
jgi:hypothetical protein